MTTPRGGRPAGEATTAITIRFRKSYAAMLRQMAKSPKRSQRALLESGLDLVCLAENRKPVAVPKIVFQVVSENGQLKVRPK